ncbi:hypothetical protein IG631_07653 [Alternaria alternata]|nr:hypothetical protein IG631_07653 [Alternaria alternata]
MNFFRTTAVRMYRWSVELAQLEHDVASSAPLTFFHYPTRVRGRFAERGVSRLYSTSKTSARPLQDLYNTSDIGVTTPSPAVRGSISQSHGMEIRRLRYPYAGSSNITHSRTNVRQLCVAHSRCSQSKHLFSTAFNNHEIFNPIHRVVTRKGLRPRSVQSSFENCDFHSRTGAHRARSIKRSSQLQGWHARHSKIGTTNSTG